jgi:hypothetical protein
MMAAVTPETAPDPRRLPSRKAITVSALALSYEELALTGVRSREVTERIVLHLRRFGEYLTAIYGHERLVSVVRRDVVGWRDALVLSGLGDGQQPSRVAVRLLRLGGGQGTGGAARWGSDERRQDAGVGAP